MIISAIEANLDQLRPSERLVANFVLGRPSVAIYMSIADLAEQAVVSEPTIMRFCKAVGCKGFMEFKLALARDLDRRTFSMNRTNPAVKGPAGFGQALFARVVGDLVSLGDNLPLDKIDQILEWCGASRAISILHDGSETSLARPIVDGLLACRLEASAQLDVKRSGRHDGRVLIVLRSAQNLTGLEDFCRSVLDQEGKVVLIGFDNVRSSLTLVAEASRVGFGDRIAYLVLAETLRLGIEARLSRTGAFADTATDLLQSQREIAYGDARRRDRQSAQASADVRLHLKSEAGESALNGETV